MAHVYSSPVLFTHSRSRSAFEFGSSFLDLLDSPDSSSEGHDMSTPKLTTHGYAGAFATHPPSPRTAVPAPRTAVAQLFPTGRAAPSLPPPSRPLPVPPCSSIFSAFDAMPRRNLFVPLPSPANMTSSIHPAQAGARRLSINTVKKLSSRPVASPTMPASRTTRRRSLKPRGSVEVAHVDLPLPSPTPSSVSSDLPDLTADEETTDATEWEDEQDDAATLYSPCVEDAVIHTAVRHALPVPAPTTRQIIRKKRAPPPPLTLHVPPPSTFLVSGSPSPRSAVSSIFDSPLSPRVSPGRKRRMTRASRTSIVPNRASVVSTASAMPTFAQPASAVGEDVEPASPDLLHPCGARTRVPGPSLQQVQHTIEEEGDFLLVPAPADTKARKRLGLDANDNVVEVAEYGDAACWRPQAIAYVREVRAPPPQKKSTFSVRKLFARRR